jgi:hypothetical protein
MKSFTNKLIVFLLTLSIACSTLNYIRNVLQAKRTKTGFYIEVSSYNRFREVEKFGDGSIFVDVDTGLGYFKNKSGGMFPIYNVDGEIYRPNGWRDYGY